MFVVSIMIASLSSAVFADSPLSLRVPQRRNRAMSNLHPKKIAGSRHHRLAM